MSYLFQRIAVTPDVVQFLQGALPHCVTVAEPQTLFGSIRGDAP